MTRSDEVGASRTRTTKGLGAVASKIITYEALGTTWKVHRDLAVADSPGLAFIQDYLSGYEFYRLEWLTLRRGAWGFLPNSIWTNTTHGGCRHPNGTPSGLFRINCTINTRARCPAEAYDTVMTPSGKRKMPWTIHDEQESIVYIVAHEASHYLGSTNQIPSSGKRNSGTGMVSTSEIEAGEFARAAVEAYRVASRDTTTATPVTDTDTSFASGRCLQCGMMLFGYRSKFCSDACRWTYHNHLRCERTEANRQKVCAICGTEFTARRADAKTCSPRCRQRLRRRRRV